MENRKTFMGIFGTSNAEKEENLTTILGSLENNTNYNAISNTALNLRSTSMETVWAFDNPSYTNEDKIPTEMNEFGIPTTLQTSHMKDDYDPHRYSNIDNPTSFWGTVFHLIIISSGPALFTIPVSFLSVGYVIGFVGILLIVYIYAYNMHMMVWSEYQTCKIKHIPRMSYADTVFYAFKDGPSAVQWCASYCWCIVNGIFILCWLGGCCYNMVLIGESLRIIINGILSKNIDVHIAMMFAFIPLLLLCWVRKLSYLVPFSILGSILNFFSMLIITGYLMFNSSPYKMDRAFGSVRNMPLFLGSVMFSLNATGILLPLKHEMKEPGKFDGLLGTLGTAYVPVSFLYAFFGLLCTLKFGDELKESVIENLPPDNFLSPVVIVFYTITLTLQFPLVVYVVFDVIWNNFMKEKQKIWSNLIFHEYAVRTGIVVLSFLVAYLLPDVTMFLSLSGTVCTSLDSMIFPAVTQTLVTWKVSKNKSKFTRNLCKNIVIIMLAFVLIVMGLDNCMDRLRKHCHRKKF